MKDWRILNIGCGKDLSVGTDFVDKYPLHSALVLKCDIDTDRLPYADNFFDVVYSKNLLEHLRNPLNFFEESKRVLKMGGILEIVTDHANYWKWALPEKAHSGGYTGEGIEDKHYCLFTYEHLVNFGESVGLKVWFVDLIPTEKSSAVRKIADFVIRQTPFKNMSFHRVSACYQKIKM